MMVSTRGRYALRVIIDLAENAGDGHVPMREVAERQGLSLKYLERILPLLVSANLVEGVHGKAADTVFLRILPRYRLVKF